VRLTKHLTLLLIVIIYATVFAVTFDNYSVQVFSIALIGLCGWFYGIRTGLASIPFFILLNTAILYTVSGKLYDILLTYDPIAIIFAMILTIATGAIRESQDKLNELQKSLHFRINEATSELDILTKQLIETDERERIRIGQDLHDGIGQYLTGMLLHSEALSYKLRAANRMESDLAERMTHRINHSMQIIRKLSRSQLPINFTEISLETALNELMSYFSEISGTKFRAKYEGDSNNLPMLTAQHLHRIFHEIIYNSIYTCKAKGINVLLTTRNQSWKLDIEASSNIHQESLLSELISMVIDYRNREINGNLSFTSLPAGEFHLAYAGKFEEKSS
jgi:signal transduction histidine kinase